MTSFKILNIHWGHHLLLSRGIQTLNARPIRFLILTAVTVLTLVWLRNVTRLSSLRDQYPPVPNDQFYHWNTESVIAPFSEVHAETPCERFPASIFETVQVVLKTGMTDDPKRLLTHLDTVTKCIPNLLIVSDHDDLVKGRKIYDVLAGLSASYQEHNPDFETYHTQKKLKESGNITEYNTEEGWKLDRFKFLPMIHKAFDMSPQAKWFVFIETDTYIFWDNLFRLLLHFNSSVPMYMGSPLHGNHDGEDYIYAYGGSGIVLSNAASRVLLERKMDSDGVYIEDELYDQEKWMGMIKNSTYGETILGYALQKKAGVKLSGFYPMFHPLSPEALKFSEENLCTPIISMHKFWSEKVYETLWSWEMGSSDDEANVGNLLISRYVERQTDTNIAYTLLNLVQIPLPSPKAHPKRVGQLLFRCSN
jgi:hypothetical protein